MEKSLYQVKQKPVKEKEIHLLPEDEQASMVKLAEKENYETSNDDEACLKWLKTLFETADQSRPTDKEAELRYKQFLALLYPRADGMANVNLPIEFATIENKMADMLSQKPIVQLLANEPDDLKKISLMKYIWDFVWLESDTDRELFQLILTSCIFGTGWWWEGLRRETYTRFEPVMGKDGLITKKPIQETRSWLGGRSLDFRHVWVQPVPDINDADWCFIMEQNISYDEAIQLTYDPNYNAEAIHAYLAARKANESTNSGEKSIRMFQTREEALGNQDTGFNWMHFYNKRKGIYIVTDEDFTFMFRNGANPYPHGELPISPLQDHMNYRSIYGRGECELLESTKYERNMIRNQTLDYVRMSNTMNMAVGSGITFEDQELVGGVARVWNFQGDLNQMQFMKPPQQDSGLFSMDEMLQNDATWITGVDNNALLGSPSKTAFEARLQEQQKLKRIFMSLRLLDFFYTRMGRQRLANIQFFLPYTTGKKLLGKRITEEGSRYRGIAIQDVKAEPIPGVNKDLEVEEMGTRLKPKKGHVEFLELTPEKIKSNMDIIITTPSTTPILRDLNRAEMQQLLQDMMTLSQFPKGQEFIQRFEPDNYMKIQAEGIGVDIDDILSDPEQMTPQKEQGLMQELTGDLPLPPKDMEMEAPTQPMNPGAAIAQEVGMPAM